MNARDFLHAFGNFFIRMVMVPFRSTPEPSLRLNAGFDTMLELEVTL
jgi:hypothetical protein